MSFSLISRRIFIFTKFIRTAQIKCYSTTNSDANNKTKTIATQEIELPKETGGYDYFQSLTEIAHKNPIEISKQLDEAIKEKHFSVEHKKLENLKPVLPPKSFSLAAYANDSEVIKKFIQLGVDLKQIEEKHSKLANIILKLDFETDVQPMLLFLCDNGVDKNSLGKIITKCPEIFDSDNLLLQENINYFLSKKFSKQAIGRIITRAPRILIRDIREIDQNLGFLQKEFMLLGDEVRESVTKHPKLITFNRKFIHLSRVNLKDICGFTDVEIKHILMVTPKILLEDRFRIERVFKYVHNVIGINHSSILHWPDILKKRIHFLKERHEFLKSIGRDQYDETKANFVSTKALSTGKDSEFCEKVAKTTVKAYNDFLRTL